MRVRKVQCAAIAAAVLSAAACGSATSGADAVTTLRVGSATASGRESSIGLTYLRNALSRETLVTLADDGRAQPRILESWEASADGLEWRLHVRQGVRFHNGVSVAAAGLAPQVEAQLRQAALGAVRSVRAEGETLVVSLHEPYAFLFEDLAVMSAQLVEGGVVFGTGPYETLAQSPQELSLRAVRDHYRGDPEIERIEVELFPDQRNAWSALMRDQIDMLYEVSSDSLEFIRGQSGVRVATFPRPYVYLLGLNLRHPALANKSVRQALDRAVDREELVRVAMDGEGEPATGHFWPRHWTFDEDANAVEFDQRGALRLLQRAGLQLVDTEGQMPARLRLHCLVYEPLRDVALLLQRQLAEIDVELDLELVPTNELIERITKGDFEAFIFEMASARGVKWPYQFWHSTTSLLKHGYSGADDVLDAMRRAPDDEAFRAAAVAFQRRLHEDPPAVFLAWGRTSRAVSNRFEIPKGDDDIYHTIARWKPAAKAAN